MIFDLCPVACIDLCPLVARYYGDISIDLTNMLRQSTPTIPIILLYSVEVEMVTKMFHDFANRKQAKTLSLTINDDTPAIERTAKRIIHKGLQEVGSQDDFCKIAMDSVLSFKSALVFISVTSR